MDHCGVGIVLGFMLMVIPFFLGDLFCQVCNIKKTVATVYLIGIVYGWAVFEIIAVPAIKMKYSLTLVTVFWCFAVCGTALVGMVRIFQRKRDSKLKEMIVFYIKKIREVRLEVKLLFFAMVLLIGFQMYMYYFYQHTDADDARFIANAVAAWDSDRMLLTHPNTGEILEEPIGELKKDSVSPWMIYIAMLARITLVHPTILAHTILPVFLVGMGYCAYWLLGSMLFKCDAVKQIFFVIMLCLFNIFGYTSKYAGTTFFMTRIWQGKSVVAGVMVPLLFAFMLKIAEDYENKRLNWLIFVAGCGACLLSGTGIIFSALLIGCFVFVYAVQHRSLKGLLYGLGACVPNIVLGILYMVA